MNLRGCNSPLFFNILKPNTMKFYQPTPEEIDALNKIMPHAIDIININEEEARWSEDVSDADRRKIYRMSRDLYQSALKMRKAISGAIFC